MIRFLNKLSQLHSVRETVLLSRQGKVLFHATRDGAKPATHQQLAELWQLCQGIDLRNRGELLFENSRLLVENLGIGSVITIFTSNSSVSKVSEACNVVREKVASPPIRKKILLKLLQDVEPAYRSHVVEALAEIADKELGNSLLPLFRQKLADDSPDPDKLLPALCRLFGNCRLEAARESLEDCVRLYSSLARKNELAAETVTEARIALRQLELDHQSSFPAPAEESATRVSPPAITESAGPSSPPPPTQTPLSVPPGVDLSRPEESAIHKCFVAGDTPKGVRQLLELIEKTARQHDFDRAESLRDWLIHQSPMSLTEIIQTAELITEEKQNSIDPLHLATWQELASFLAPDEFANLYHALEFQSVKPGEMVIRQGDPQSKLLFVNSGKLQIYARETAGETVLKTCLGGEIFGADTFFDLSVWTVSAKSLGVELGILQWERLLRLNESCPALRTKLMEFCERFPTGNDLFARTRRNRRQYERKRLGGKVSMSVLDANDQATPFQGRGDLLDISKGGVSFLLRFTRKKNAVAFLNRRILMTIRPDSAITPLQRQGTIKAIRCQDFVGNDYSIHVEFKELLTPKELLQVTNKR